MLFFDPGRFRPFFLFDTLGLNAFFSFDVFSLGAPLPLYARLLGTPLLFDPFRLGPFARNPILFGADTLRLFARDTFALVAFLFALAGHPLLFTAAAFRLLAGDGDVILTSDVEDVTPLVALAGTHVEVVQV